MTISITLTRKNRETIINHSELFGKNHSEMAQLLETSRFERKPWGYVSHKRKLGTRVYVHDDFFAALIATIHTAERGVRVLDAMLESLFKPFFEKYLEEKKPLENIKE